jgi:hypothetical protein
VPPLTDGHIYERIVRVGGREYKIYNLTYTPPGGIPGRPELVAVAIEGGGGGGGSVTSCNTEPDLVVDDIYFIKDGETDLTKVVNAKQLVVGDKYHPVATISNRGCLSTGSTDVHQDQMPFGKNGHFPIRLQVNFGNDRSLEVDRNVNDNKPLSGSATKDPINPSSRHHKFPAITVSDAGIHSVTVVADPRVADFSGAGCSGAWGCIKEVSAESGNTREESFTAVVPQMRLGSFLMTSARQLDTSSVRQGNRKIAAGENWGLYWRGDLVDFTTCTGDTVSSGGGRNPNDFKGRQDTNDITNALRNALPVSESRTDININEPNPGQQHTYTITCNVLGSTRTVTDSVTIDNSATLPECGQFNVRPRSITAGEEVHLTWSTNYAADVIIRGGSEVINGNPNNSAGRRDQPNTTTTYTLTARSGSGERVVCPTQTVTVTPPSLPICSFFNATPIRVQPGDPVYLSWGTVNASRVEISGLGSVNLNNLSGRTVRPLASISYQLTAENSAGAVDRCRSPRIEVGTSTDPQPSATIDLVGSLQVYVNQPIALTWTSTNVQPGSCTALGAWTGARSENGSQTVTRATTGPASFRLTCTDLQGASIEDVVVVNVLPLPVSECQNGRDDSDPEDTLADRLDPGCWTNPSDISTYNPNDTSEDDSAVNPDLVARLQPIENCEIQSSTCTKRYVGELYNSGASTPVNTQLSYSFERRINRGAWQSVHTAQTGRLLSGDARTVSYTDELAVGSYEVRLRIDRVAGESVLSNNVSDPQAFLVRTPPVSECQNGRDDSDSEDTLADRLDPGCYGTGNPNVPSDYDPADNSEDDSSVFPPQPTVFSLTASNRFIRYNTAATIRYQITAAAPMNCELTGPGVNRTFVYAMNSTVDQTVSSNQLKSTQSFKLTCTPTLIGPAITREVLVEVIPQVQEI